MNNKNEQLCRIVEHAAKNTPFYRKLYKDNNVDINKFLGIDDIQKLPIITSQDLIANGMDFMSENIDIYRISSSSGTSNKPKSLFRTRKDTDIGSMVMGKLLKMAGLTKGDSIYIGQPFDMAHLGYLTMNACERLGVLSIPAGLSQSNEKTIELLSYYKPTAIFISISRLKAITEIIKAKKLNIKFKHILVAGEPMFESDRKIIRDYWQVEPIDLYGSEETDGLAGECKARKLHFMDDLYHLELLPIEGAKKNIGEAVITSLYSEGTPLIRYRLGDIIEIIPEECECGSKNRIIKVHGKIGDVVTLFDGIKLYAYQIEDVLKQELPNLSGYQIVCSTLVQGLEEIRVKVVTADVNDAEKLTKEIENKLWDCSLDLDSAKEIGSLRFRVEINKDELYVTRRGKTPKIIDLRIKER
ncbi:phenylacetate--CoA ligase family protein [Clostridiaceae bacterium M8S5]|nr:phenylacetate--CoA ligase family protein [Clostridiaceae bacterium M8S5]